MVTRSASAIRARMPTLRCNHFFSFARRSACHCGTLPEGRASISMVAATAYRWGRFEWEQSGDTGAEAAEQAGVKDELNRL